DPLNALGADAAGNADGAALLRKVREQAARFAHHADVGAQRAHLAGAEMRACRLQVLVIQLRAPPRRREDAAGRSTDVNGLELGACAAGTVQDRAERRSELDLVHAGLPDRS